MIRRLGHLCLVTDDLKGMVDFYTEILGLAVKFIFKNAGGETFGYFIDCGDSTFIEIFDRVLKQKQWGGNLEPLNSGNRFAHFCLEVTGLRELTAALTGKGLQVSAIGQGLSGSLSAWTNDPDGNSVELLECTSRSLQIQRPPAGTVNVASPKAVG